MYIFIYMFKAEISLDKRRESEITKYLLVYILLFKYNTCVGIVRFVIVRQSDDFRTSPPCLTWA